MLLEHRGKKPTIAKSAYIAPNATICGDVTIGDDTCVLFGAVITADGGSVVVGRGCIIMENAVIRGTGRHPTRLGDQILVGPRAYLTGCTIENNVFLATGSTIFNGAVIETEAEVRINGVVHVKTRIAKGTTVPIGWVAVGDPAEIRPPKDHDEIWAVQKELGFAREIFGIERTDPNQNKMPEVSKRYTRALAKHKDDIILDDGRETE